MTSTYSKLQKVSPGGSVDNWKHICHCVQVVFEVLHEAWKIGRGKTTDNAGTMWGCLQGIQAARDIIAKGFSAHLIVANVLSC